jgi:hypothetical protein
MTRTYPIALAALIASLLLASPVGGAIQEDSQRPSPQEARNSIMMVYGYYAESLDGQVRLPERCPAKGSASRVCNVEITGALPQRLRVVVTGSPEHITVSARVLTTGR